MCLVVLAFQQHPEYPLIVAGNRDEFHKRPSKELHWWPDHSDIVGGRDLQAGGTWLALHRSGRFATVTNYRDADVPAARLREVNLAIERCAWGAFSTEFYATYDFTPVAHSKRW